MNFNGDLKAVKIELSNAKNQIFFYKTKNEGIERENRKLKYELEKFKLIGKSDVIDRGGNVRDDDNDYEFLIESD